MSAALSLTDPAILARAVHFGACVMVAGVVLFDTFIATPALAKAETTSPDVARLRLRLVWLAWVSLMLAVISGAAWLVFTAMSMSGAAATDVLAQGTLWTVLTQTTFGNDWLARVVVAGALAWLFLPFPSPPGPRPAWLEAMAVLLAAFLIGSLAWAGHAIGATGIEGVVHPAADVLHLIAAAAWVGALIPLALLLQAAARDAALVPSAHTATLRFSALGIISVATLLVTGSINTWYLAGSIAALRDTDYGRLLSLKVALFFAMVTVAAINRLRLTPRLAPAGDTAAAQTAVRRLRDNALIEAAVGAAIIVIVAVLGILPPASHAAHEHPAYCALPADAAFVHIHGAQGMAEVLIEPGRVGTARATIHLLNEDEESLAAKDVTLTLTPSDGGGQSMQRSALQDADGAWQVDGIELAQPGNWTVTVDAALGGANRLMLAAPIVIDPK
jgi:copper resistance protein D